MGKHLVAGICGVAAGAGALYSIRQEDSYYLYERIQDRAGTNVDLEISAPDTTITHLAAFAVGRISGMVPVSASYDKVRWGPLPNCNLDYTFEFPFIAEPIIEIGDLKITSEQGGTVVTAELQGDIEVLNPRATLSDLEYTFSGGGFGQVCDEKDYDKLLNRATEIGGLSIRTVAECLVGSVQNQYIDNNGNQLTDASAAIQQIYRDDLEESLSALYPNAVTINVMFPDADPGYNISQTESYQELQSAIDTYGEDKYIVNADPVLSCTFEPDSLSLDISVPERD